MQVARRIGGNWDCAQRRHLQQGKWRGWQQQQLQRRLRHASHAPATTTTHPLFTHYRLDSVSKRCSSSRRSPLKSAVDSNGIEFQVFVFLSKENCTNATTTTLNLSFSRTPVPCLFVPCVSVCVEFLLPRRHITTTTTIIIFPFESFRLSPFSVYSDTAYVSLMSFCMPPHQLAAFYFSRHIISYLSLSHQLSQSVLLFLTFSILFQRFFCALHLNFWSLTANLMSFVYSFFSSHFSFSLSELQTLSMHMVVFCFTTSHPPSHTIVFIHILLKFSLLYCCTVYFVD